MLRAFLILMLCAPLVSCATSQSVRPETSTPSLPPVPEDPLALVVENPESVAVANVQAVMRTPLFARLRPYIERATCINVADWNAVLSATRRAALAVRHRADQPREWLLVLAGSYTEADARRVLALAHKKARGADSDPVRDARDGTGRFGIAEQGALAVSQLEGRVLVVGTQAWARAAIGAVAQPTSSFSGSPLWRTVGLPLGCSERSACLLSAANSNNAEQIERGLASAGARQLGQALSSADSALGLSLSDKLSIGLAAQLASNDAAQVAERGLRDWLWQANMLVRLTGLPAVLDRTQLSTQGALLRGELDVTRDELDAYEARAKPLFDREAPSCSPDAQSL